MTKLIVALDYQEKQEALAFAKTIQGEVEWVKVGLELFISSGYDVIYALKDMGFKVFVDLKLHDIPNTVAGAVKSLLKHKADMLTLHIVGGQRMLEAAIEVNNNSAHKALLMGVTVLTSIEKGELYAYDGEIADLAEKLALSAQTCGLNGIIASGQELKNLKSKCPKLQIVCPGIRLEDSASDDQRRIISPSFAKTNGADFIVVGRPITKANNPVAVVKEIQKQIA